MARIYVRADPGGREILGSLAVAVGVGALSFYVARMLLSREGLESTPPTNTLSRAVGRRALAPAADE